MPSFLEIHSPGQSRCKSLLWYIPCLHTGICLCADRAPLSRLTFLHHPRLRSGQTPVSSLSHLALQLTELLANGSLLLQPKTATVKSNKKQLVNLQQSLFLIRSSYDCSIVLGLVFFQFVTTFFFYQLIKLYLAWVGGSISLSQNSTSTHLETHGFPRTERVRSIVIWKVDSNYSCHT